MSDFGAVKIWGGNNCDIRFSVSTLIKFYYKNQTVMDGKRLLCYGFTMRKLGVLADFCVCVFILLLS